MHKLLHLYCCGYINQFAQVRKFLFAIVHSTTIALPAWREACVAHSLCACLIPRDIKTRWNSTYDMLKVMLKYCEVIDNIMANKSLKLQKFELDDEDWTIVKDLLCMLKVSLIFTADGLWNWQYIRCIKMQHCFSLKTLLWQSLMLFQQWTGLTQCWAIQQLNHWCLLSNMLLCSHTKSWINTTQRLTCLTSIALLWVLPIEFQSLASLLTTYAVLHPQLKLKYFQQHGWPQDWVCTAETIVREEFIKYDVHKETVLTSVHVSQFLVVSC